MVYMETVDYLEIEYDDGSMQLVYSPTVHKILLNSFHVTTSSFVFSEPKCITKYRENNDVFVISWNEKHFNFSDLCCVSKFRSFYF